MPRSTTTTHRSTAWRTAASVASVIIILWLILGLALRIGGSGLLGDAVGFEVPAGVLGFWVLPVVSIVGAIINVVLWSRNRSAAMLLVAVVPLVSSGVLIAGFVVGWP